MEEKKTAASAQDGKRKSRREPVCENLSFAAREAFKRLRTNLIMSFPREDNGCRLIGITSAQPNDGKSTIAINLAYSLAELGKKTLLIDADMRRSTIHEKANVERSPGLSDLMSNTKAISPALRKYQSSSSDTTFDIIPSGDTPQNPSELLSSRRMARLLRTVSTAYKYIVIDLPPIGAVVDAVSVAREIDGMLVVIRENTCPRGLLDECIQQLDYAGVKVLGFVVNGALEGSAKKYRYSDRYSRYNKYY